MKSARTSLHVGFPGSTSIAALVLWFTCASPGAVLADELELVTATAQTVVPPEGALHTMTSEGERPESTAGSNEGPGDAAAPGTVADAVAEMSSAWSAKRETASVAENHAPTVLESEQEPIDAVWNEEPSLQAAAPKDTVQNELVPFDADANMPSPDDPASKPGSIAEHHSPSIPHAGQDALAVLSNDKPLTPVAEESGPHGLLLFDPDVNVPAPDNSAAKTAGIAENNNATSIPGTGQDALAILSNDKPSIPTAEESGKQGLVLFDADASATSLDNAEARTLGNAESREPQIRRPPEDAVAEDPSQIMQSEALPLPTSPEIVGASNYRPSAPTADPCSSDAEPGTPTIVTGQATDSAEALIEAIINRMEESPPLDETSSNNVKLDQEPAHTGTVSSATALP
jgi:hypothetical protein